MRQEESRISFLLTETTKTSKILKETRWVVRTSITGKIEMEELEFLREIIFLSVVGSQAEAYSALNWPSHSCACRVTNLSPLGVHMEMKTVSALRNPAQVPLLSYEYNYQNIDHGVMVTWREDLLSHQVNTIRKQFEDWPETKRQHTFFFNGAMHFIYLFCFFFYSLLYHLKSCHLGFFVC